MTINESAQRSYDGAVAKGFHADYDRTILVLAEHAPELVPSYQFVWDASRLMGIVSELSEVYEARRDEPREHPHVREELADVFIRLGDTVVDMGGDDFEAVIKEKQAFNEGRPHLHGRTA